MEDEDLSDLFEVLGEFIVDVVSVVTQPWVAITLLVIVLLAVAYVASEEPAPHFPAPASAAP